MSNSDEFPQNITDKATLLKNLWRIMEEAIFSPKFWEALRLASETQVDMKLKFDTKIGKTCIIMSRIDILVWYNFFGKRVWNENTDNYNVDLLCLQRSLIDRMVLSRDMKKTENSLTVIIRSPFDRIHEKAEVAFEVDDRGSCFIIRINTTYRKE